MHSAHSGSFSFMLHLFIYLFHLFNQGKPKQLTLVFIGAVHNLHFILLQTCMSTEFYFKAKVRASKSPDFAGDLPIFDKIMKISRSPDLE